MLAKLLTRGVEVGNGGQIFGFALTAMTDERVVSRGDEGIDDGPPDEAGSPEDDYSHAQTLMPGSESERTDGRFRRLTDTPNDTTRVGRQRSLAVGSGELIARRYYRQDEVHPRDHVISARRSAW